MAGLCQGRQVRVAYNQVDWRFFVYKGKMWFYPVGWSVMTAASGGGSYPYEILATFFAANQLSPTFMNNHGNWAHYDYETGLWSGAVAMVRTDIIIAI